MGKFDSELDRISCRREFRNGLTSTSGALLYFITCLCLCYKFIPSLETSGCGYCCTPGLWPTDGTAAVGAQGLCEEARNVRTSTFSVVRQSPR
ncbi:hypothetical protein MHYP_G00218080 [Metynnis hypsauchen]